MGDDGFRCFDCAWFKKPSDENGGRCTNGYFPNQEWMFRDCKGYQPSLKKRLEEVSQMISANMKDCVICTVQDDGNYGAPIPWESLKAVNLTESTAPVMDMERKAMITTDWERVLRKVVEQIEKEGKNK
jgi:hypothetical protein